MTSRSNSGDETVISCNNAWFVFINSPSFPFSILDFLLCLFCNLTNLIKHLFPRALSVSHKTRISPTASLVGAKIPVLPITMVNGLPTLKRLNGLAFDKEDWLYISNDCIINPGRRTVMNFFDLISQLIDLFIRYWMARDEMITHGSTPQIPPHPSQVRMQPEWLKQSRY